MSSHHVVREKQEPALLVLGLNDFSDELLGQLLEWSPTVITMPDMAEKLDAFGIKIDWIIIDGEGIDLQSDIRQMPADDEKPVIAALKYLLAHNYPAVNIVSDMLNLDDVMEYADKINLVIFQGHQKIYAVASGFSKWKPAGDNITLLSQPANLHLTGLEATGIHSYKTTHDGFFTLRFKQPYLFIAESI